METDAFIDSGAENSLFNGAFAHSLGIDLLDGRPKVYVGIGGNQIDARIHGVKISNPDIGEFALDVGFSTSQISRNLLGRDFFNLVQIGFRERQLSFMITPEP